MRSTLWPLLFAVVVGSCGDNESGLNPDAPPGSTSVSIGGTVTGLTADGLVLANNAGDDLSVPANATSFTFSTELAVGESYDVTVKTQPAGEDCTVAGGTGVATADVQSVTITCVAQAQHRNEWTWTRGSDVAPDYGVPGVYGTQGVPAAANHPGGRHQSVSWRDADGNFWLFGGYGKDSLGNGGQLNDIWKLDRTTGLWTWVNGNTVAPPSMSGGAAGSPGVYGTLGVPAATNVPGGREQVSSWIDASGALWVFGGAGIDVNGVTGELNDLWKFSGGQWTWMGGSQSVGAGIIFGGPSGTYGTLGVPDPANVPGGRYGAVQWMDDDGNFWLFGGSGIDSQPYAGRLGYLNDLWKYTPGANGGIGAWTWMAGADTVPFGSGVAGEYGTRGTPAPTNYPGGRDASMSWVDASGTVWIFGGIGIDSTGAFGFLNDMWKYEPSSNQWTWVSGPDVSEGGKPGVYGTLGTSSPTNLPGGRYSAAAWVADDGTFWMLGGQGFDSTTNLVILNDLWKFDPATTEWTWMGGSETAGLSGGQPGVYGTLGEPALTNVPGGRYGVPTWTADGQLWMFGGMGYDKNGDMGYLDDLWAYRP